MPVSPGAASTPTPTASPSPSPVPEVDPVCPNGTMLVIVAHYDDDLIFANPRIAQRLDEGVCVRTVYLTAGDAGESLSYSLQREEGIKQAYTVLAKSSEQNWKETEETLGQGLPLIVLTPEENERLSLIFARLPDGGLLGGGFPSNGYESLQKLEDGKISTISPLGSSAQLTLTNIEDGVRELIERYEPDEIITLIPHGSSLSNGDHSDHSRVGTLVRDVLLSTAFDSSKIMYAMGYETGEHPENVSGPDLGLKLNAFIRYSANDYRITCSTIEKCLGLSIFGPSLSRQYLFTEEEVESSLSSER